MQGSAAVFVFLDSPFDPDFPVYTRANAGEILPHPLSPLCWSIIGPPIEEGFRISFCDDFGLLPRPGTERPYQVTGRIAARLHFNLSVLRTAADRLPGTSAAVVDTQYFGDAGATGLPAHRSHPDDRRFRLRTPASMGRTLAGLGRRVDRDRADVDEFGTRVRAGIDNDVPDAALIVLLREGCGMFARLLGTHVTARALTSPILEQAIHALERGGVAAEDALRHVSTIPGLESAKPSRALAAIAATITPESELATVVAHGSLSALADSGVAGAEGLHRRVTAFVSEFGHRGIGEFDPTLPAWEQRPDDVVAMLGKIGPTADPSAAAVAVDPGRIARPLVAAARSAMARAERTKDTTMRATNQLRRILFELRSRWHDEVADDLLLMCTLDELEAAAHGAGLPVIAELERRASAFADAASITVAEWSAGTLRSVESPSPADPAGSGAPSSDGDLVITGIAGSPGVCEGRARVIADPYGDFDDGDIIVAEMTDTAWTPLFLVAGGVVTDMGGVLSHATIVARDLGIPAVVNTKSVTSAIRDGDMIRVDGTHGTVTRTSSA